MSFGGGGGGRGGGGFGGGGRGGFGDRGGRGGGRGGFNRRGQLKDQDGPPLRFMPESILALFRPRPETEFKPPVVTRQFTPSTLSGVGDVASLVSACCAATSQPPAS